jgi:hypothetical protein
VIDGETAQAAQISQSLTVDDLERQAELGFQFVLPLERHRRGRSHKHEVDAPAEQKFAEHQARLDRLAQPDIVGDQQIDPW